LVKQGEQYSGRRGAASSDLPPALAHRVDAALARFPLVTDGLDVNVLYDEPANFSSRWTTGSQARNGSPWTTSPANPAQTARPGVERLLAHRPAPDGSPAPDGPIVEVLEDKLELIAAGQAVPSSRQGSVASALI